MKKVYAKQVDWEKQDPFLLSRRGNKTVWDDEYYASLSIIDCIHSDVYDRVADAIDNGLITEINNVIEKYFLNFETVTEAINYYLPSEKENGKGYSKKDIKAFKELVNIRNDIDQVVAALSIVTGKKYCQEAIRGSCQGDYEVIVYPKDEFSEESIKALECMFFNMGSEWQIHDAENEPGRPEDIQGYYQYYCEYDIDTIKELIAKDNNCNIDDVILYAFKGYNRTAIYEIA